MAKSWFLAQTSVGLWRGSIDRSLPSAIALRSTWLQRHGETSLTGSWRRDELTPVLVVRGDEERSWVCLQRQRFEVFFPAGIRYTELSAGRFGSEENQVFPCPLAAMRGKGVEPPNDDAPVGLVYIRYGFPLKAITIQKFGYCCAIWKVSGKPDRWR